MGYQSPNNVNRRNVLKTIGTATGTAIIPLGTATASGSHDAYTEIIELDGDDRDQLLANATESAQTRFISETIGELSSVELAGRYTIEDDHKRSQGNVVVLADEAEQSSIKYYESDDFEDGRITAVGEQAVGRGIRKVDGVHKSVVDIGHTPKMAQLGRRLFTIALSNGDLPRVLRDAHRTDRHHLGQIARSLHARSNDDGLDPVLVQMPAKDESRAWLRVPLGTHYDQPHYLHIEGSVENPDSVSVTLSEGVPEKHLSYGDESDDHESDIGVQNHVECFGFYCVNYCTIFCGTLSGAAGGACGGICAASGIATALIFGCGVFCTALVGSICVPTCRHHTGH